MRKATSVVFGVLLVGLLAAGCSTGTEDTTTSSETTVPDTTTVTTVATTTTEAVAADASCVVCHTDEATLQALAVEPVAGEGLSEGEG
jgi:ABC-type Fe3+-citrate transport system substrate-binding protein